MSFMFVGQNESFFIDNISSKPIWMPHHLTFITEVEGQKDRDEEEISVIEFNTAVHLWS